MGGRYLLAAIGTTLLLAASASAVERKPETPKVSIGDKVGSFTFKDIRFLPRTLSDLGEKKAYVIVFTTLDCPLVQRYLPRVKELEAKYRDQDVQFVALNVGPKDKLIEVAQQGLDYDLPFHIGKDFDGEAVRALGVERTPEVVVLDGAGVLKYRGRIDSQFRLGGENANAGRQDLEAALEDVLAGRDVKIAETPVDGCRITPGKIKTPVEQVTYSEHIAPLMQQYCQECHRPGTTAPFSLLDYDDADGNAEMIAEVVREQRMPPLYASEQHGHFSNRVEMKPEEIELILAWASGSREKGDAAKLPPPREFAQTEWQIGEPDVVYTIPKKVKVPATGIVAYKYIFLPHVFEHDTWVQGIEILPGNPRIVHHANLAAVNLRASMNKGKAGAGDTDNEAAFITGYVPGGVPMVLDPGTAFKIPKGSVLVLQSHYVTTGKEGEEDETRVGLVYAKGTIQKEVKHFRVTTGNFAIPPGDAHHRVVAQRTLDCDATGLGMFVHMHVRGKDMTFLAHYPDGRTENILSVPNYNFDWQLAYRWPTDYARFPKGTKIECIAHYDNSAFNPYNPDPAATVREGQQTHEEMMYGFFFYMDDAEYLNLEVDPKTGEAQGR
ncbi:MAG: redoxin family protein [Pirellulales bacterium]|nr:redoxin family protein [Pirellulales bacterium]